MKNVYLKAQNFLCFGPEGIEINFDDYGNIINIWGENLDVEPTRSNGTGKSSIPEIFVYALYGKTIKNHKKIKHANVINNQIKKKLHVEAQWDNYRIVRTRKPDSLRFWESEDRDWNENTERTLGTSRATQEEIDKSIGLSYDSFINIVMFTDRNEGSFLECDGPEKRKIVENLLSLEKYREYCEIVKELRKKLKENIELMLKDLDRLLNENKIAKNRVDHIKSQETLWRNKLKEEIKALIVRVKIKKKSLEATTEGSALALWQQAQEEIKRIQVQVDELERKKKKLEGIAQEIKANLDKTRESKHVLILEMQTYQRVLQDNKNSIKNHDKFIRNLEERRGGKCPYCFGIVTDENCNNAILTTHDEIKKLEIANDEIQLKINEADGKISNKDNLISKFTDGLTTIDEKQRQTSNRKNKLNEEFTSYAKIPRPDVDAKHLVLEKEIEEIKKQAMEKTKTYEGSSPYAEILNNAKIELNDKIKELDTKSNEIEEARELIPYYDFWAHAFGDAGIRKFIIDGIIPALNSRVSYWLDYLMDGIVSLIFDNELNETIERSPPDGDAFVYHAMSAGEKRMLNLAVSQAFAHVMILSYGTCPPFVFLDEAASNMDDIAKQGVYNMIYELSKSKQVFVTSHDPYLLNLLEGCDRIGLVKKQGFTKLVN